MIQSSRPDDGLGSWQQDIWWASSLGLYHINTGTMLAKSRTIQNTLVLISELVTITKMDLMLQKLSALLYQY